MITLRIISASNLPAADKNGKSDPYVLIYPVNHGKSRYPIAKTKTIKKTLNPNWDQNISLPFVAFSTSLRLVFMDADKLSDDDRLGLADIYPSITNFYRHDAQIQVANILIDEKYKLNGTSILQYSIIPTFTEFDFKAKKDPKRIYVYLSFDSFQPDSQDKVSLLVYGVNRNGTLVDPAYDLHSQGEYEASHFSPMGLVQVFVFDKTDFFEYGLIDEKYFFILHAKGFTGKATLTFVSSPKYTSEKKFVEHFHIFNNQYSLSSNGDGQYLIPFHTLFKFTKKDVQIEPLLIPSNLQNIKIESDNEYMIKLNEVTIGIAQMLCPTGRLLHKRFYAENGKRYSLNDLFQKSQIKSFPSKINISIGWDSYTDLDLLVFPVTDDYRLLESIGSKAKKADSNHSIKSKGDSRVGTKYGDDEVITIDLNNISPNIKYIMIFVSSSKCEGFCEIIGGFLRFVDDDSNKEVLFTKFPDNSYKTGLLWGVMGRFNDSWSVWSCSKLMDGSTLKAAQASIKDALNSDLIDQFRTAQH